MIYAKKKFLGVFFAVGKEDGGCCAEENIRVSPCKVIPWKPK
jgi:hypothetical protein